MRRPRIPREHPIAKLGLTLTAVERATGGRVQRPNLWKVVNGERNRLGLASLLVLVETFPALKLEELAGWEWTPAERRAFRRARSAAGAR